MTPFSTSLKTQLSYSSCSAPSCATNSTKACGITTAPSSSTTITSPGKIAQPPQPIGSLPADEGQAVDRGRRGDARAPDRQRAGHHAGAVAHHAVGDQRRDIALFHAGAKDVAEYAGARHAHGVGDGDDAFRHVLDRGARRDRAGPTLRRRQIFPHRHEAQSEGRADNAARRWRRAALDRSSSSGGCLSSAASS